MESLTNEINSHYYGFENGTGIDLSDDEQRQVGAFLSILSADIYALSDYHQQFTEADVRSKIDLPELCTVVRKSLRTRVRNP